MDRTNKATYFLIALTDLYKEDDNRESGLLPQIEIKDGDVTEDMYCMFLALKMFYRQITDEECDSIDFLSVLTRLVFQFTNRKE